MAWIQVCPGKGTPSLVMSSPEFSTKIEDQVGQANPQAVFLADIRTGGIVGLGVRVMGT